MDQIGYALQGQGKFSAAADVFREKWNSLRKTLDDQNPNTVASLVNLADTLVQAEKADEAGKMFRDALRFQKTGTNYSDIVWTLANLAAISRQQTNSAEAGAFAYEAIALCTNYSVVFPPWKAYAVFNRLKDTFAERGDNASVEVIAAWCVQNIRTNSQRYDPRLIIALSDHALVLARNGKAKQGRPLAEEAVKLCLEHPPTGADEWMAYRAFDAIRATLRPLGDDNALEMHALLLVESHRKIARDTVGLAILMADTADTASPLPALSIKPSWSKPAPTW